MLPWEYEYAGETYGVHIPQSRQSRDARSLDALGQRLPLVLAWDRKHTLINKTRGVGCSATNWLCDLKGHSPSLGLICLYKMKKVVSNDFRL